MQRFPDFLKLLSRYSDSYAEFEAFQKDRANDFIPEHGDQKTGVTGEAFVFEYLRRKGKLGLAYGSASEKSWDIRYTENGKHVRVQVKTTSEHSKTRTISPIDRGWDRLFLVSLNLEFLPDRVWTVDEISKMDWPEGKDKKIEGKKMPRTSVHSFGGKYLGKATSLLEDFVLTFPELKK